MIFLFDTFSILPKHIEQPKFKFNWICFLQPLLYGAQIKSKLEMKKTHDGVTVQFTSFLYIIRLSKFLDLFLILDVNFLLKVSSFEIFVTFSTMTLFQIRLNKTFGF